MGMGMRNTEQFVLYILCCKKITTESPIEKQQIWRVAQILHLEAQQVKKADTKHPSSVIIVLQWCAKLSDVGFIFSPLLPEDGGIVQW